MPTKKGWKDIRSRARIKKQTKIALGILAFIAGLLIVSWIIRFTQVLSHPWGSTPVVKRYAWNGEFNINLLIRTPTVSLLSYNPKKEKIVIVNMSDETLLEVPHGFGLWQLRAIYGLGQTQKDLGGNKLLADAMMSFLAVPIDGFLDFSSLQPPKSPAEIVDILRKNPVSGFNLLSSLKTDLTLLELLRFKLGLNAVRFDKIKEMDLLEFNVLEEGNLSDGTKVYTADPVKLDSVLSDLADPVIISEHKTVAVLNATDHPQLAGKWARLITNLGGNVIITANANARLKNTQVSGEQSLTLKRMRQIFILPSEEGSIDCQKCDKINFLEEDLSSSRAQINLLVGEDFADR